jgi:hypothetical protein
MVSQYPTPVIHKQRKIDLLQYRLNYRVPVKRYEFRTLYVDLAEELSKQCSFSADHCTPVIECLSEHTDDPRD